MRTRCSGFNDQRDDDQTEWEEEMARLENAISQSGRHDLQVITQAGVNRKALLTLLALAAKGDRDWMLKIMRQRQSALKSLSKRLYRLADEAKERADDPLSAVQFWTYLNGGSALGMQFPKTLADDPGADLHSVRHEGIGQNHEGASRQVRPIP